MRVRCQTGAGSRALPLDVDRFRSQPDFHLSVVPATLADMRSTLLALLVIIGCSSVGAAQAQAIKGFCAAAQQHVAGDPKLSAAVEQVFGHPFYGVASQQDAACIYPLQVLRYASADVLLTAGNEPGQACHGCSASVSAYFLARRGGGLQLVNRAIDFAQEGTSGDPGDFSAVSIGGDDGMAVENGGTFGGHTTTALHFYAFRRGRVVPIEAEPPIYLSASNGGSITDSTPVTDVAGSWSIVPGPPSTLRVDYRVSYGRRKSTGSATWSLIGERWRLSSGQIPPELRRETE